MQQTILDQETEQYSDLADAQSGSGQTEHRKKRSRKPVYLNKDYRGLASVPPLSSLRQEQSKKLTPKRDWAASVAAGELI